MLQFRVGFLFWHISLLSAFSIHLLLDFVVFLSQFRDFLPLLDVFEFEFLQLLVLVLEFGLDFFDFAYGDLDFGLEL